MFHAIAILPKHCSEVKLRGYTEDGVYTISPIDGKYFDVFCELTAGDSWTVILLIIVNPSMFLSL